MIAKCSIADCAEPAKAKALCSKHYQRLLAHGDPLIVRNRPNGSGSLHGGYVVVMDQQGRKPVHVRVAEKALGKPLPPGAIVHHVDENKANNAPSNLVICPDRAYHNLLHQRMRARDACGNPNWRMCWCCHQYDAVESMRASGEGHAHRTCENEYQRNRYHARKSST